MKENVVRHLREAVGVEPDEVPAVYGDFIKALDEGIAGLHAAVDPVDFRGIRSATHLLMGFARNVGAADLGDAAHALNAAAHAADADACRIGIREVEALCNAYRDDAPDAAPPTP